MKIKETEDEPEDKRQLRSDISDFLPIFNILDLDDQVVDLEYEMFITKIQDREVEFRVDFVEPEQVSSKTQNYVNKL